MEPIVIVGSGICGLALGIAFQKLGINFHIYEKVANPKEVGAGLTIWPNATAVLKEYQLLDEVSSNSGRISKFLMYDQKGNYLTSTDYSKYNSPSLCIHRATLYNILLNQINPDKISFGYKLNKLSKTNDDYIIEFENGHTHQTKFIIGADGIHSTVRNKIASQVIPNHCGYYILRAITNFDDNDLHNGRSYEYMGRGIRFGAFSIGKGKIYWYINANGSTNQIITPIDQHLANLVKPLPTVVKAITDATPLDAILINDTFDINPFHNWHSDGILVVGDAAHASTPNLGQGACMAIEDSWILASLIKQYGLNTATFDKFVSIRYPRTSYLQKQARNIGKIGQYTNPFSLFIRDSILRLLPDRFLNQKLQPIYVYRYNGVS